MSWLSLMQTCKCQIPCPAPPRARPVLLFHLRTGEQRSGFFDGVFALGVLHHLPYDLQCVTVKECIRVTKDGGKIYIGWNGNHIKDRPSPHPTKTVGTSGKTFWEDCLAGSTRVKRLEMTQEKEKVVGNWGIGPMDETSFGRQLPNYAIEIWIAGS